MTMAARTAAAISAEAAAPVGAVLLPQAGDVRRQDLLGAENARERDMARRDAAE